MTLAGFGFFLLWMIVLIALSFFTDWLLARIFPNRTHRIFVGLGVIIHELSHWFACVVTRTHVFEVSFFDETGGHVKHAVRGPVLMSFIAMFPLIGCSLFMMFLAWVFGMGGVRFVDGSINLNDPGSSVMSIVSAAGMTLWNNFATLGVGTLLFVLFMYLDWSVVACLAPSRPDLGHAALGMTILCILCCVTIYFQPLSFLGLGPTPALDFVLHYLSEAIGIGIIMTLIPLVIAIPVAIIKSRSRI
jgi:uncharacterized membrane protein (DUF485 family)